MLVVPGRREHRLPFTHVPGTAREYPALASRETSDFRHIHAHPRLRQLTGDSHPTMPGTLECYRGRNPNSMPPPPKRLASVCAPLRPLSTIENTYSFWPIHLVPTKRCQGPPQDPKRKTGSYPTLGRHRSAASPLHRAHPLPFFDRWIDADFIVGSLYGNKQNVVPTLCAREV